MVVYELETFETTNYQAWYATLSQLKTQLDTFAYVTPSVLTCILFPHFLGHIDAV